MTNLPPPPAFKAPGFGSTFASEWTKLTSVRSTYISLILGITLSIAMTALVAAATGATWDDWTASDRADFDPVLFSIFGTIMGGIVFTVMGVLAFASEYSSGMIRTTFTATPRRGRVLMAKVLAVSIITGAAGMVTTLGMFFVGQAVLAAFDMPTASIGDGDALRTVATLSIMAPLFPLIGLTLAAILRSTAGAITSSMAIIFAPSIFGGLLPNWWQENIVAFNPSSAADAVSIGHLQDSPTYLDAPAAAAVVAVWLAIFIGGAFLSLVRRDA